MMISLAFSINTQMEEILLMQCSTQALTTCALQETFLSISYQFLDLRYSNHLAENDQT
jgi:hypothetical protein